MTEERMDQALASSVWLSIFMNVKLANLIMSHSNHIPISCDPIHHIPRRFTFHFENNWWKEDITREVELNSWMQEEHIKVERNIFYCADQMEKWSKNMKGNLGRHEPTMELFRSIQDTYVCSGILKPIRNIIKLYWVKTFIRNK